MRDLMFAALLACACACVVAGVAMLSPAAGLIAAGVLLAPFAWLVFGDVGDNVSSKDEGT